MTVQWFAESWSCLDCGFFTANKQLAELHVCWASTLKAGSGYGSGGVASAKEAEVKPE